MPEPERAESALENPERVGEERELTPEEKKAENVRRLTAEAMAFVSERKREKAETEARKKLEERPEDARGIPSEGEAKMGGNEQAVPGAKKKPGLLESLRTGWKIRRMRKEGFADPEKALAIQEYVRENVGTREKVTHWNGGDLRMSAFYGSKVSEERISDKRIEVVYECDLDSLYFRKAFKELSEGPNDAMEVMSRLAGIGYEIRPSDIRSESFVSMIKDPDVTRKIDAISELGIDGDRLRYHLADFFKRKDVIDSLDHETVDRIKSLSAFLSQQPDLEFVEKALPFAKDDAAYDLARIGGKGAFHAFDLKEEYERVKSIEAAGLDREVLRADRLGIDASGILSMRMEKARGTERKEHDELEKKLLQADVVASSEDPEFTEFLDKIKAVMPDGKINVDDFLKIKEFRSDPEFWAFFESASKLGMLKGDEDGNFSARSIEAARRSWDNAISNPYADVRKKYRDGLFDPEFQEFAKGIWESGANIDLEWAEYIFLEKPKARAGMDSESGRRMLAYLAEKGISIQGHDRLFEDPEIAERITDIGDMFVLGNNTTLDDIEGLSRQGKLHGVIDLLDNIGIPDGRKFNPNEIYLLEKLFDSRDRLELDLIGEHFDFYFNKKVIDRIGRDPDSARKVFSLGREGVIGRMSNEVLADNLDGVLAIPKERRDSYFSVFGMIDASPSQEIQRMKSELISQLLEQDDPVGAYARIEEIFVKNNLPPVGKAYKVFATLNGPKRMAEVLAGSRALSPCLRAASERKRYFTVYDDLLNVHIRSGNRDFREYLEIFQEGDAVFEKLDRDGEDGLNEQEIGQARKLIRKMRTLRDNSALGKRAEEENREDNLGEAYHRLRESIGAKDGQSARDRISRMFLAPAGYATIEEALGEMDSSRRSADRRGKETAEMIRSGEFHLKNGDLIKGVPAGKMEKILQGGIVAREFLGSESESDSTPYDSDFLRMSRISEGSDLSPVIKDYYSSAYGEVNLVIRDRGQLSDTSSGPGNYETGKYELFRSGIISQEHYGIRTGLPSSEIDLMAIGGDLAGNERRKENLFFEIAKNGSYVPVIDLSGKLAFSPDDYDKYRKFFNGIDEYDGDRLEFVPTAEGDRGFSEISGLAEALAVDRDKVNDMNGRIRLAISEVLERHGISMQGEDTGILGAVIDNTGSTGRHTNLPDDYDFDLVLRLDNADMAKVGDIVGDLRERFGASDNGSHDDNDGGYQLRTKGASGIGDRPADIDIAFVRKSELVRFGSHDAVESKLEWLRNNVGEDAYGQAVANIVLAKRILKEGHAYKKQDDGGFGGIGVENWILANGCSMEKAFESFQAAAHDPDGNVVPLEEFRKRYKLIDPGINLKFDSHDNFINVLSPDGYKAMIKVIDGYFGNGK